MCPFMNTHASDWVSIFKDGDARVKNRSDALIFSKSRSSFHNFNRSYLCEISDPEAPLLHGYIYTTRSFENTSIFFAPSAGAGLLRKGTLRDGRPFHESTPRQESTPLLILHHYPTSTQPPHKPSTTPITHYFCPPSTTNT